MVLKLFLCPRRNISPCDPERADQPEKRADKSQPDDKMMMSAIIKLTGTEGGSYKTTIQIIKISKRLLGIPFPSRPYHKY